MDDVFITEPVDWDAYKVLSPYAGGPLDDGAIGQIHLNYTNMQYKPHKLIKEESGVQVLELAQDASARLSCQPTIWNRHYLLQYLNHGLTPWLFEMQNPKNDGWRIIGTTDKKYPVKKIDGVRKHNVNTIRLQGDGTNPAKVSQEDIDILRERKLI